MVLVVHCRHVNNNYTLDFALNMHMFRSKEMPDQDG